MTNICMVCGEELKQIVCTGRIGDMEVDFCDEHAEYCENCESIRCRIVAQNSG